MTPRHNIEPSNTEYEDFENFESYEVAKAQAQAITEMARGKAKGLIALCVSVPILIGLLLVLQTFAAVNHVTLDIDKQIPLMLVGVVPAVIVVCFKGKK